MSYKALLNVLYPDRPLLDTQNAILSAPVRHVFMMGTVWHLCRESKRPLNILEVGSWFGASTLTWGEGLKRYADSKGTITCLDAWTPFLDTTVNDSTWYMDMNRALDHDIAYQIFQHNTRTLPKGLKAQHLRGKSEDFLPMLRDETFDICFIDADHAYSAVLRDLKESMRLVKMGGILCGDDLNLQMHECDQNTAREFAEKDLVKDPKTGRNMHPGVTVAVDEILGRVSAWGGFWAMQKTPSGWKPISLKEMPVEYPQHFGEEAMNRAKSHLADIAIS
jgi:predicted O-methyltransferase YrrM